MCALVFYAPQPLTVDAQQPTGSIPTVTGTPVGVIVALYLDRAQENVYAGPSSYLYPPVGLLIAGQEVPAYGISDDGNWIQIYYPGVPDSVAWVYAPFVKIVKNGSLPLVKAPPIPTPTALSLDPTLAAAFIAPSTPTRLPTFTAPAPLVVATFVDEVANTNQIPMGLLIFGLGFVGGLGVVISFLGRR
jgi:hypothetical protein